MEKVLTSLCVKLFFIIRQPTHYTQVEKSLQVVLSCFYYIIESDVYTDNILCDYRWCTIHAIGNCASVECLSKKFKAVFLVNTILYTIQYNTKILASKKCNKLWQCFNSLYPVYHSSEIIRLHTSRFIYGIAHLKVPLPTNKNTDSWWPAVYVFTVPIQLFISS